MRKTAVGIGNVDHLSRFQAICGAQPLAFAAEFFATLPVVRERCLARWRSAPARESPAPACDGPELAGGGLFR